jgi:DNA-directed RNA polymerase specialized sigma24 family protein
MNHKDEAKIADRISCGDSREWRIAIFKVTKGVSTWNQSTVVDVEEVVLLAIWKASKNFSPKRRFINHAIHIARNMLCQRYRHYKVREDIQFGQPENPFWAAEDTTDVLDKLIAKETVDHMIYPIDQAALMARLILTGKNRADSARILGVDRFRSHALIKKLRQRARA